MDAYLALGSNLGDRMAFLNKAVKELDNILGISVIKKSDVYQTKPYGDVPQDDFLNCVIQIETHLSPLILLNKIHEVEAKLERERLIRWGPRTIDIDIIWMDCIEMDTETLTIPHKELTLRSFVLIPLKDVYSYPTLLGKSLDEWIQETGNANDVNQTEESWSDK